MPVSAVHAGVDIGGTKMLVIARKGEVQRHWVFPTGPGATPRLLRERIEGALGEMGTPEPAVIGVAVPGLVDPNGEVTESDVLPALAGWNPRADWPEAAVLNDGEAALVSAAAGEPGDATVAAVGCGTGIVAAFQLAGRRLRRYRPYSGELGYVPCGPEDTFDSLASGAAILRELGLDAAEVLRRLERQDERCRKAILGAGEMFGLSLVTLLHLVHPSKIALYGGTLRYPGYLEAAMRTLQRRAHAVMLAQCRVEVLPNPEFVVAEGALLAALDGR